MGVVQAIKLMRSSIPGQIPALPMAQVAVNLTDKILFVGFDGTTDNVIKFVDMSGVASMISTAAYVHPSDGGGSIETALSGANVISKIIVNASGHVTGTDTRELAPSDIGAAPIGHTMYIGTTGLALNRSSVAVALTGITSIDGSAAKLTTPRALTIGSTAKNFDGSTAVSWSLADINTHLNTIAGLTTQGLLKRTSTTWVIDTTAYLPAAGGTISGNLTVTGDLVINGDTVTANVETMTVEDPIITLGGTTAPTVNDGLDRGVEFRWHNGTVAKVGFFGFDRSSQKFTFIPDAINTNEVFGGAKGTIVANLEGNASTATKVNEAVTFNNSGSGAISPITFDGSEARIISYNTIGAAALAGSPNQDFSTNNLTVHGHLQIGSARLVYVPETEDLPAYLKLQHSDGTGTTVMHFVTSGGVTMYSAGMPSGGSSGGATVLLNGESTEFATFWAPTSAGSSGQYLVSSGTGAPIWADFPTTFAPSDHTHDDRYYTMTDINAKLANKDNWNTAYSWGNHASAGYAAQAGSASQNFSTKNLSVSGTLGVTGTTTLAGGLFDKSAKTITFSYGVGITSGALTLEGKETMKTPYIDFFHYDGTGGYSRIIETATKELSIYGGIDTYGKIKLKSDTYAEKALYIGGANGAKLVFVPASGNTPAYLKLQNYDGGVMHFVTTGGQTMYSTGVPAEGGGGSATVILNGATENYPAFYAPTSSGSPGQYLVSGGENVAPSWITMPTATSLVAGIMKLGASGGAATFNHGHSYASLSGKPDLVTQEEYGFMSAADKRKLDYLYPVIYNAGAATGKTLADASGSIPDYLYNTRSMLLIFGDGNEQHVYLWIATTNLIGSNKTDPEKWLRISKPDVDGGTY